MMSQVVDALHKAAQYTLRDTQSHVEVEACMRLECRDDFLHMRDQVTMFLGKAHAEHPLSLDVSFETSRQPRTTRVTFDVVSCPKTSKVVRGGLTQVLRKSPIQRAVYLDAGMKFALNVKEECPLPIEPADIEQMLNDDESMKTYRLKKRFSWPMCDDEIVCDMTVVKHVQSRYALPIAAIASVVPRYELEVECLRATDEQRVAAEMCSLMRHVVSVARKDSLQEHFAEYVDLVDVGAPALVGPQAVTLDVTNVARLASQAYSVTQKLDGRRAVLYVSSPQRGTCNLYRMGRSAADVALLASTLR